MIDRHKTRLALACLCALTFTPLSKLAANEAGARITITNPSAAALKNTTVSVPWSSIKAVLPQLEARHYEVIDAATRETLVYQQQGGNSPALLFQYDFEPGETRQFLVEPAAKAMPAPRTQRLNAREVPERIDDFAWENDRMAYRVYGPKAQRMIENGVKGGIISSGVDVWAKRVPYPILDKWYKGKDYHKDHGEGADFFSVGPTLGAGGLGFLVERKLVAWPNWTASRIIEKGPVRLIFELDYPAVDVGGRMISGTKRFIVDRGESLFRCEVTFYENGNATTSAVDYVVGLVTHTGTEAHTGENWGALWGPVGGHGVGDLGTGAVLVPDQFQGISEEAKHLLVKGSAPAGEPARFMAGAVWTERGYYVDFDAWSAHLNALAEGIANPLQVRVEATELATDHGQLPPAAASLPSYEDSLAKIRSVIDWQQREPYRWSDQGWIRPIHFLGMLEVAKATKDVDLREAVRQYCEKHDWKRETSLPTANELLMGLVYIRTNQALPKAQRGDLTALIGLYEQFLEGDPNLNFSAYVVASKTKKPFYFIDSLFTGGPGLAALINETEREDFRNYFHQQYWAVVDSLRDPDTGLFFRDKVRSHNSDGSKSLWARGNGWIFGGLALILENLPKDDPEYPRYVVQFRELAEKLAPLQQPDGFWRANLADIKQQPQPESSGTALMTFAYAYGLNAGILDRETYLPVAARGWNALTGAVDNEGFLRHVQAEAAAPGPIHPGNNIEYATGAFLLAGAQVLKLSKK